jgi:DNA uptake protein ComE-like DNA-binding protein
MARNNWWAAIVGTLQGSQGNRDVQQRILNDPYYRLRSPQEIELAASLGVRIDVNQATVDDWLRLPGLSIHQARTLAHLTSTGVQFYGLEDVAAALGLPPQALLSWKPVLSFCYYDAESPLTPSPVNANAASIEQLLQIPVVDLFLARAIVHNRQAHGVFRNVADLQQRLALPPATVSSLLHYLRFS